MLTSSQSTLPTASASGHESPFLTAQAVLVAEEAARRLPRRTGWRMSESLRRAATIAVVNVSYNETKQVGKSAYRTLARRHHPDAGGDATRMAQINDAWAILGDPVLKPPPYLLPWFCSRKVMRSLNFCSRAEATISNTTAVDPGRVAAK